MRLYCNKIIRFPCLASAHTTMIVLPMLIIRIFVLALLTHNAFSADLAHEHSPFTQDALYAQSTGCTNNVSSYIVNFIRGYGTTSGYGTTVSTLNLCVNKTLSWEDTHTPFAAIRYVQIDSKRKEKETLLYLTSKIVDSTTPEKKAIFLHQDDAVYPLFFLEGDLEEKPSSFNYIMTPNDPQKLLRTEIFLPITTTFILTISANSLQLHQIAVSGDNAKKVIDISPFSIKDFNHDRDTIASPLSPPLVKYQEYICARDSNQRMIASIEKTEDTVSSVLKSGSKDGSGHTTYLEAPILTSWPSEKTLLAKCELAVFTTDSVKKTARLLLEGTTLPPTQTQPSMHQITARLLDKTIVIDRFPKQEYLESQANITAHYPNKALQDPESVSTSCDIVLPHATITLSTHPCVYVKISKTTKVLQAGKNTEPQSYDLSYDYDQGQFFLL